jgi:hypothetical protein
MEHHPIPQQITSYEFQLVGDMTLKQFIKLAAGLILAFVFYHSQLPFFFKWPLTLGCGFLGVALAFLPVNERPLEVWILAFFQSIFSPSIRVWQKQAPAVQILTGGLPSEDELEEPEPIPSKQPQLEEFIASLPKTPQSKAQSKPKPKIKIEKPPIREEKKEPEYVPESKKEFKLPQQPIQVKPTAQAEFGDIPMPEPPKTPNIIVGMVTDNKGKIIENVILEIQDTDGNPVRALRTNQIGQFETATALANGEYILITEKENYQFDIIKIEAKGEVIPPIKIKAKT